MVSFLFILANVIFLISYLVYDILALRALVLLAYVFYCWANIMILSTPGIFTNMIFSLLAIGINIVQISKLMIEKKRRKNFDKKKVS